MAFQSAETATSPTPSLTYGQEPSKEVHKYTSSSPTPRRSETASLYNYRISSFIGAGHDTGAVTSDGVGARVTSVADALGNVNRLLAVVPDGD